MKKNNLLACVIIFSIVFSIYIKSPIITSFDSRWTIFTSLSIIQEGNTNLDEYKNIIIRNDYYAIEKVNGHYYSVFPVGTSLIAVPFVAIAIGSLQIDGRINPSLSEIQLIQILPLFELILASFFCSLASVLMFLVAKTRLSTTWSIVIVIIFSFCTANWSTSSRALWQHGPSMLMLTWALLLLLNKKQSIYLVAIPLSLAFIIRPTNAISIIFISLYIFQNNQNQFGKYIITAIPFSLGYFVYNLSTYNSFFPNYTQLRRVFHFNNFFEALAGNLISPSRGLFIFSPILLLAIWGFIKYFPKKAMMQNSLVFFIVLIIISHWLLISTFPTWWAGHSYGPRFFSDLMPLFMYPIILVFENITAIEGVNKITLFVVIFLLTISSLYFNYKGAFSYSVYEWNSSPNNIDSNPDRVWDWSDSQIFR